MANEYKGFFKEWEIAVSKRLINEFQGKWELLRKEDPDDLLQECLTHWYFVKKEYNADREASEKTFMARIITNKLANIVKGIYRDKRKPIYQTISLEQEYPTIIEAIEENNDASVSISRQIQLKIDISKVLQKLTPRQQMICHLIGNEGLTIKEISENLKISRDTIYEDIRRIKRVFGNENLEEYMK